jgi:broad specificity phosphatase PhoE
VQKRAAKLRSWLFNRKEEVVVVVSHGGFLHALTEDWTGFVAAAGELALDIDWKTLADMARYRMAEL